MKEILEKTVSMAKDLGAECDVLYSKGNSFSISAQKGDIDKYSVTGSQIIGIRAIKNGRVGISYSESIEDHALEIMVKNAIDNSSFTDENEFETIFSKEGNHIVESILEEDTTSLQEKIDFGLKLESEVYAKDKRVQAVPYNGFSEGKSESYYLNSNNKFCFDSEKSMSCYTSALITDGVENSMNYYGTQARKFSDLDFEKCISESLEHASNWLGAKPVATGSYDIIFHTDELESIFNCFSGIFSAKGAWDKVNPFADKLNNIVAHKEISVVDMPRFKDAFYNYHFDSEGVDRKDLCLLENGELKNFYHNSSTANYFKTQTTGHASRSSKGGLGVSGTNIIFKKGSEKSPTSGTYIELCSLQGLHSGASAISGEFSFGASGYLCRDGKREKPIKGITVAGNFYKMLKEIECVGDRVFANSSETFFAPIIRFSNMKVAGS